MGGSGYQTNTYLALKSCIDMIAMIAKLASLFLIETHCILPLVLWTVLAVSSDGHYPLLAKQFCTTSVKLLSEKSRHGYSSAYNSLFQREPVKSREIKNETVVHVQEAKGREERGKMGFVGCWGEWVAGRSSLPKIVSVVFSESNLDPPSHPAYQTFLDQPCYYLYNKAAVFYRKFLRQTISSWYLWRFYSFEGKQIINNGFKLYFLIDSACRLQ